MSASRPPRELELATPELKLAGRAWGPNDSEPVLALHGWLDNAATFNRLAPQMPGTCVVAVDLPGHGRSDHRPAGCWYQLVDYVADVLAAADAMGWSRFTLLGHSLGGAVATLLAATHPERIAGLHLVEALGPLTEPPDHAPQRLRRALERARQTQRREPPTYTDLDSAVAARREVGGLSADAARHLVERGTAAVARGLCWRSDRRLRWPSPSYFTEDQVQAFLAAIEAPTRIVQADQGLLDPNEPALEKRLRALGRPPVYTVAGHHHVHLEDPGNVARALGFGPD